MRINYFLHNKKQRKFDVLTEFIAEDQIASSYNVEKVEFSNCVGYPKFIYKVPNYGIFCFCSEEKQKYDCDKASVEVKINLHQISREHGPPLDSYNSKNFLDYQILLSSLVDGGVSIKKANSFEDIIEVKIESEDFEKIRSDYYMTIFFVNYVYRSKESIFYFDNRLESSANILFCFKEEDAYSKTCNLLDFSPNKNLSVEKSVSKDSLFIEDILSIVNLNSA